MVCCPPAGDDEHVGAAPTAVAFLLILFSSLLTPSPEGKIKKIKKLMHIYTYIFIYACEREKGRKRKKRKSKK